MTETNVTATPAAVAHRIGHDQRVPCQVAYEPFGKVIERLVVADAVLATQYGNDGWVLYLTDGTGREYALLPVPLYREATDPGERPSEAANLRGRDRVILERTEAGAGYTAQGAMLGLSMRR